MKKTLILILVLVITLSLNSFVRAEATINYFTGKDTTGTKTLMVEMFEREYPDINVELTELPANTDKQHDTYVTKFMSSDSSVDIIEMDIMWPPEFGAAGWLEPLDKYFTEEELNEFLPGSIRGNTYKGTLYGIPIYIDAGMLYYRKDIVKNPPETWEQLYNQAQKYRGKKGTTMGFTFQAKQYEGLVCDFLEYVWSNGGRVLDEKGNVVINSPQNLQALKFFKKLIDSEITPTGITTFIEESSRRPFTEGKAVFHRNWPYVWPIAQDKKQSKVAGKVGIVPMPKGPQGESGAASLGGWNLAISKFSNNKDAAAKFIKFYTSYNAQVEYSIDSGRAVGRKDVYKNQRVLKANPYLDSMYDVFLNAKPRPVSPYYPKISDVIQVEIHKVIEGIEKPSEALEIMQQIEKII